MALFVPGAGIVRAIIAIYDTIVFFIQKAKRHHGDDRQSFLGSIAEIAAGNIGAAADALERGLASGLKLVIGFLAKLLRLDGITARIRAALECGPRQGRHRPRQGGELGGRPREEGGATWRRRCKEVTPSGDRGRSRMPSPRKATHTSAQGQASRVMVHRRRSSRQLEAGEEPGSALAGSATGHPGAGGRSRLHVPPRWPIATTAGTCQGEMSPKKESSTARRRSRASRSSESQDVRYDAKPKTTSCTPIISRGGLLTEPGQDPVGWERLDPSYWVRGATFFTADPVAGVAINLHVLRHYQSRTYGTPVAADRREGARDAAARPSDDAKRRAVNGHRASDRAGGADIEKVRNRVEHQQAESGPTIEYGSRRHSRQRRRTRDLKEDIVDRIRRRRADEVCRQDLDRWSKHEVS